jgi:hypothetical protein
MKSKGDMGTKASEKKLMTTSAGTTPDLARAMGHVTMQKTKGMGKTDKIGKADMDCGY